MKKENKKQKSKIFLTFLKLKKQNVELHIISQSPLINETWDNTYHILSNQSQGKKKWKKREKKKEK